MADKLISYCRPRPWLLPATDN